MSGSSGAVPVPGVAVRIAPRVVRVLAPNAGAWTFEGTNTWLIGDPDSTQCAVVDPGPEDYEHLDAIVAAAGGRSITEVLLTHGHDDHADGAAALADRTGARVFAQRDIDGRTAITDGQQLVIACDVSVTVLHTPGHTKDSVCLHFPDDSVVATGDTLLGAGSPVVHPALLSPMLSGLQTLADIGRRKPTVGLPGHGPVIADLQDVARRRIAARIRRIEQVAALRDSGTNSVEGMVAVMYRHIDDPDVLRAAYSSVLSMVTYLEAGARTHTADSDHRS